MFYIITKQTIGTSTMLGYFRGCQPVIIPFHISQNEWRKNHNNHNALNTDDIIQWLIQLLKIIVAHHLL